jgi:hypothetical protein
MNSKSWILEVALFRLGGSVQKIKEARETGGAPSRFVQKETILGGEPHWRDEPRVTRAYKALRECRIIGDLE